MFIEKEFYVDSYYFFYFREGCFEGLEMVSVVDQGLKIVTKIEKCCGLRVWVLLQSYIVFLIYGVLGIGDGVFGN